MSNLRVRNRAKLLAVNLRLRQAVEESGLTQRQLARACHAHLSSIGAILRRGALPRLDLLLALVEVLEVSPDWLLLGRGHPRERKPKASPQLEAKRGAVAALEAVEHAVGELKRQWR